jgi:myo-inositol-1(or 4)-monophosphatase
MDLREDVERVSAALDRARTVLAEFGDRATGVALKPGGDPVTEADHAVNAVLRATLPRAGEGWLSEENADDVARLAAHRVWVVDPLDGTREFVLGLPEWSVSVALVIDGLAVVGGVCNPATGDTVVGGVGLGVTNCGLPVQVTRTSNLAEAEVLASRSEFERGQWGAFEGEPFRVRPCGSVAYKLALVAAGCIDATWTLVPKHEWDVAAGVALVHAAGGNAWIPDGSPLRFNNRLPRFPGLAASGVGLASLIRPLLEAELSRAHTAHVPPDDRPRQTGSAGRAAPE